MSSFSELHLTPVEFGRLARLDKHTIRALEDKGVLSTVRVRVGNVDRKMVTLEAVQEYFRTVRNNPDVLGEIMNGSATTGRRGDRNAVDLSGGDGAVSAGDQVPVEAIQAFTEAKEAQAAAAEASADSMSTEAASAGADASATNSNEASSAASMDASVATATEENTDDESDTSESVAAATVFIPTQPTHKTQMFYNVKGGTGKSTLTAQYVMNASMMGLRVLAIDLDGQGHLTLNLDLLDAHERPTVYDVLINDLPIEEAIVNVAPGLDLVPANLGLCNIEIPLNHKPRREYRLAEAIARVADQYDLIVADTNPAASILNSSMLVASELVNVVCATNPLSFHGMSLVMTTIEELEREFRRELAVRIIPNMFDNREVISQEVLGELRSQFADFCTETVVNRCVDLNEATKRRTTVWDVNSKGAAAHDIGGLTYELLRV